MSKLIDIKGYWDMSYNHNFNDNDMWEGQILLNEDGWFEGIVVDPSSSYTEDRFIFGVYHPTKVIELFKFTPLNVSDPFVFHGTRDAKGYEGTFEAIGLFGSQTIGVSHIITQYVEDVRKTVDEETKTLEEKIQRYKNTIMDETGKEFYDNSIAMRNSMCEIILRNYEGKPFTNEESKKIMEECQPVNDRVFAATEEEANKLGKKISKDFFSCE